MCIFQSVISLLIIANNCLPYLENDDKCIQLIPSIVTIVFQLTYLNIIFVSLVHHSNTVCTI